MDPNILLLVLDTARADAFEPYGAPRGASPVIADLAASGHHAPLAYAPSSWTVPSHAAMFAGALPRALGLGQAPGGTPDGVRHVVQRLGPRLLPTVLRGAGYTTVGASCNAWIGPATGFDTGFDRFDRITLPRAEVYNQSGMGGSLRWLWHGARAQVDDGAEAVAGRVRDWFDGWDGRQPFFWFVNLVECHSPYLPPRPWNDLPLVQRLRAARDVSRYQTLEAVWRHNTTGEPVPPAALERMHHLYGRSIAALDAWVGRILDLLDTRGVIDDTIVIVTSDHGENFGEGGLIGHAFSLDERLIRVPLVTRGLQLPEGPFTLDQLPGTLAAAIGIDRHPWPVTTRPSAVAQFDPLVAPGAERLDEVARRWQLDERGRRMFSEPLTCATDGRRKIVRWGEQDLHYDLSTDPLELHGQPVVADPTGFAAVRDALQRPELWESDTVTVTSVAGPRVTAGEHDVEALEAQMRLLGYL